MKPLICALAVFFAMAACVATAEAGRIDLWAVPAIADEWILPDTQPPTVQRDTITLRATRGQVASASFCIRSSEAIEVVAWKVHDWLDLRYVVRWYQDRSTDFRTKDVGLVPELLLHDPYLIGLDHETRRNVVADPLYVYRRVRKLNLPADETQQYWVTVRVPIDAKSGLRRLPVDLLIRRNQRIEHKIVTIRVDVLPVELDPCPLTVSMFWESKLVWRDQQPPAPSNDWRNAEQYLAEATDLADHGVTCPTFANPLHSTNIRRAMDLRCSAGLARNPLFWTTLIVGAAPNESQQALDAIRGLLRAVKAGATDVYFYSLDEKTGEGLRAQIPFWDAARAEGAKIFASCGTAEGFGGAESHVDLVLMNTPVSPAQMRRWHAQGLKVFLYGPTHRERPEWHRRKYGLGALVAGYDGIMPYSYQDAAKGSGIWDDTDARYKDHCYTYPATNGVIGTIQWEGFRQAVVDMRLAATVLRLGGSLPQIEGRPLEDVEADLMNQLETLVERGDHRQALHTRNDLLCPQYPVSTARAIRPKTPEEDAITVITVKRYPTTGGNAGSFEIVGTSVKNVGLDDLAKILTKRCRDNPHAQYEIYTDYKCDGETSDRVIDVIRKTGVKLQHYWAPVSFIDIKARPGKYGPGHIDLLAIPGPGKTKD